MTRWFSATDRLRAVQLSRRSLIENPDATTTPSTQTPGQWSTMSTQLLILWMFWLRLLFYFQPSFKFILEGPPDTPSELIIIVGWTVHQKVQELGRRRRKRKKMVHVLGVLLPDSQLARVCHLTFLPYVFQNEVEKLQTVCANGGTYVYSMP